MISKQQRTRDSELDHPLPDPTCVPTLGISKQQRTRDSGLDHPHTWGDIGRPRIRGRMIGEQWATELGLVNPFTSEPYRVPLTGGQGSGSQRARIWDLTDHSLGLQMEGPQVGGGHGTRI